MLAKCLGGGKVVVLELEKSIGKPFPLLPYVDKHEQLRNGKWSVLLYHRDCVRCQQILPLHGQGMLDNTNASRTEVRVAFLELPPYSEIEQKLLPSGRHGCCVESRMIGSGLLRRQLLW